MAEQMFVPIGVAPELSLSANTGAGSASVFRAVKVDDYPVVVSSLPRSEPVTAPKDGQYLVDFDSLRSPGTLLEIPGGYAGLNWFNWVATHQKVSGGRE